MNSFKQFLNEINLIVSDLSISQLSRYFIQISLIIHIIFGNPYLTIYYTYITYFAYAICTLL